MSASFEEIRWMEIHVDGSESGAYFFQEGLRDQQSEIKNEFLEEKSHYAKKLTKVDPKLKYSSEDDELEMGASKNKK